MKKDVEERLVKGLILATIVFFIAWGLQAIIIKDTEFVFDRFFTAAIALAALFTYRKIKLNLPIALLSAFTLLLHHLKLYGNFYFGIPFDRIMHFTAGVTLCLIFYNYLYKSKTLQNKWTVSLLAICIAAGIGSFMEIIEFVGYSFLGQGEGILFYGTGDFGEWNNLSWDLIMNTCGAILGTLIYSFWPKKKPKIKFKKIKKILKYLFTGIFIIIMMFIMEPFVTDKLDVDLNSENIDFSSILGQAGIEKENYIVDLESKLDSNISDFAKADIYLIVGRLKKDKFMICQSVAHYDLTPTSDPELLALAYETIASLNCGQDSKRYYKDAAKIWKKLGNEFRAELDLSLAENNPLSFIYNLSEEKTTTRKITDWNQITIGKSKIILDSSDILVSQTDRVSRDWLSAQIQSPYSKDLLSVFSEQFTLSEQELQKEIGWHEGARIQEILKNTGLTHNTAAGTIVIKINNSWYAPDENGVFRFEVLPDKIAYPTTRFLKPGIAIIIDTHGISSLVEQSIRYNATAVVGCCDSKGKIQAAKYLAEKDIKVICFTDRFLPDAMFQKNILGSPPIRQNILGNQPITIKKTDKIIAANATSDIYALQYYDTSARYFKNLEKSLNIDVEYITITNFNQTDKLIKAAKKQNANIIAARIFNKEDYLEVSRWLSESKQHKAILFHSTSYPYGYRLFKEFPAQTTFDDINPIIS